MGRPRRCSHRPPGPGREGLRWKRAAARRETRAEQSRSPGQAAKRAPRSRGARGAGIPSSGGLAWSPAASLGPLSLAVLRLFSFSLRSSPPRPQFAFLLSPPFSLGSPSQSVTHCRRVCPPSLSLWIPFSHHPPRSAPFIWQTGPMAPDCENLTFPRSSHSLSRGAVRASGCRFVHLPVSGRAGTSWKCLRRARNVRFIKRANFRVHGQMENGKRTGPDARRGGQALLPAPCAGQAPRAPRGEPSLPGSSVSDDSLAEFSSGSRGSAARAKWKAGPMSCGGGCGGRSPSGSRSRLMPPLKASMEAGTVADAPGAGAGRARPPWLRPAGTRAQCLSGRPPGLPAPAVSPRLPHGPPGAAGPGGRQQQRFLATGRPASRSAPAARASAARPAPARAPDPGPVSKAPDGAGRICLKATVRTARFQQSLRQGWWVGWARVGGGWGGGSERAREQGSAGGIQPRAARAAGAPSLPPSLPASPAPSSSQAPSRRLPPLPPPPAASPGLSLLPR